MSPPTVSIADVLNCECEPPCTKNGPPKRSARTSLRSSMPVLILIVEVLHEVDYTATVTNLHQT